jgi:hypothetical protein
MRSRRQTIWNPRGLLGAFLICNAAFSLAQVSPSEVRTPQLKALERTYLEELKALNHDIQTLKFEFPLVISRFVGLDPQEQRGTDTRGLEFVRFHERNVLKVSGNYNAAFSTEKLSQNQRAGRVLSEVIEPILQLMPKYFADKSDFDAIGFEIVYHVRRDSKKYQYEGKEILALVFSRVDAFRFLMSPEEAQRQDILNNSEIFVDGKEFGLVLSGREPLTLSQVEQAKTESLSRDQARNTSSPETGSSVAHRINEPVHMPGVQASDIHLDARSPEPPVVERHSLPNAPEPKPNQGPAQVELDAIQTKYQAQLNALAKEGEAKFHFVSYAPPSFIAFRKQIYLQLTLRNPTPFDKDLTSIYRRSARTFDLFLAPILKDILSKVPSTQEIAGLDVTVLTRFAQASSSSSEAIEFVCPYPALEQFVTYQITNQDFINQTVVLLNGVRIALNLQQVE